MPRARGRLADRVRIDPEPGADRASRTQRQGTARSASTPAGMDGTDGPLFTALRSLRSELARRDGVPAFVVFPDRTLGEIATRRPHSLAALAEVRGVGPVKLDRYGEQFLAAVRAHEHGAPTTAQTRNR